MSRIAVFNAGTATLKVAMLNFDGGKVTPLERSDHEWTGETASDLVAAARAQLSPPIDAVGHRVVHGGAALHQAVRIDGAVRRAIEEAIPLAPLHNTRALEIIHAVDAALPGIPGYAVFDTAFHACRAPESMAYALPEELVNTFAIRRYGFHGIAHASLIDALAGILEQPANEITAVSLQLGSGCSACAVRNGRSIETSMGYTPLEGLVMPTRSGDIDPAIILRLLRAGYDADEIERQLTRCSGLVALSGSSDVREILAAEARGDEHARIALAVFVRRIVMTIGAYLTLLNGEGVLAFGGGIGSHSAEIRRRVTAGLTAWGVEIDSERNARNAPGRISTHGSREVFLLQTNEESIIAHEVGRLL